jgi:uncharacterized membrane protein YidH (DUF202 family)
MPPPDEAEKRDSGLAKERTELAWSRTAIAFAAVGGAILKTDFAAGLTVLALSLLIWLLRRLFPDEATTGARPRRLLLVTMAVTGVSLVALVLALLGHGGPLGLPR